MKATEPGEGAQHITKKSLKMWREILERKVVHGDQVQFKQRIVQIVRTSMSTTFWYFDNTKAFLVA